MPEPDAPSQPPSAPVEESTPPTAQDETSERSVQHLDARTLRGLAHPLRVQLLRALRRHGPATASQLADRLGESSGATSYHLRQLATHGFVEDAPEHGKGRERWWRSVHQGTQLGNWLVDHADPTVRGAADLLMHEAATEHTRELSTWLGTRRDWSEEWRESSELSDYTLTMTPEMAHEMIGRVEELIEAYRVKGEAVKSADTAEEYRVHLHGFPLARD
ncbi:helix-turn-helix domain-containing protein [Streptomyces candidus]|uniref:DNA-binding transcriptional ArsR family regulator n=1 Tax=Streptomyces candidus TaxID=67283 RepID=A0A7X0LQX1_9ACTN|nr:helix-turn-helix domain-containing protein [Streptomyces candidus]MBB6436889.1 DNA-binding transcriptional ArsR family regulator [Streptomyces candidus]GHH32139.1 transcriptional regulator [Streptomyces candidus]